MNFEMTEDQLLLREMIRDFARNEISPHVKTLEEQHKFPHEILQKLGELGILGMSVPAEYGGSKTDNVSLSIAIEELARVFPSLAVIISVHCSLFCFAINRFGTEAQKKEYLPKAATGQIIGAFSLTEPEAGSDATNLKTKSEKKGNGFVLNGTKSWVTTGYDSGALILMTASETSSAGKKRLNAFILDKNTPGLSVSKIEEKMGLHASPTAEIVLENCRVPAAQLLGEEGKGASIAFQCLDSSRIGIAAQSVGVSQRALDEAVKYAKQREAFGRKIHDFQAIQFMIADMSTQLDAARLLTYRAANLSGHGKPFGKESAMAKLYASEAANRIASLSLQIHGGYGYSKEFFIEQLYRDARVLAIYEGTSEVQRLVIARHLLKQ
ncbi:MAG: acyl-CoA dehydrogenase family protein [Candidatus Aminicenantes bacterium]|nr:acyl-CoA dehydrogenase family protein [Candidatus Aminicenantes bacterium]